MEKDLKNNNKNLKIEEDLLINLGFADKATPKDFYHEKFPSKIGGNPVMLFPVKDKDLFTCSFCGGKMNFLMQLYCILDDLPHCYHRYLYLFFCVKCYRHFPAFKCIRMQLPEKSEYYNGVKAKDIKQLQAFVPDLDSKYILLPEYKISIEEESDKSLKLYKKLSKSIFTLYSNNSNKNKNKKVEIDNMEDLEDLEYDPQLSKADNEMLSKILSNYKEVDESQLEEDEKIQDKVEDEFFDNLIEKSGFKIDDDIVFKFFFNMIRDNSDQVVRYSRSDIQPLWYSSNNIMKDSNITCQYCKKKKLFEFQVMPHLFILYNILLNHDIGTIVIFTCDCDVKISEEHVYVQRTGEKLIDLRNKHDNKYGKIIIDGENFNNNIEQEVKNKNNVGFSSIGEPDEDGFVEIVDKKNKKKKKELMEINEEDSFSD